MVQIELTERTVDRIFAGALARDPDRVFLVTAAREYSYREANERIDAVISGLASRGVKPGEHVALMLDSSPDYLWILLALARYGAVGVALNTQSVGKLLEYYLSDSGCDFAIVDEVYEDEFRRAAGKVGLESVEVRKSPDWLESFADPAANAAPAEVAFKDTFLILYTSGTTGMPKGVPVSNAHAVTCGAIFVDELDLDHTDRLYTCLPFFHINATAYTLCGALVARGSIALSPRFSASAFWGEVASLGATEVNAMGSMLKILENRDPSPAEQAHSVSKMFIAPLPVDAAQLGERFKVAFSTTYAQTEWTPSAMTKPGQGYGLPGLAGWVLPHAEVRVGDENDLPVRAGERGQILLRGREPYVTFNGYFGKPEATGEAFRNLWFHTGDLGELDEEGRLFFRGRLNDVIRRRGENISAAVLEELLASIDAVSEVAAVAVPSSVMEDDIFVFVCTVEDGEMSPEEFIRLAGEIVPRYMIPKYVSFVDSLPRTATNKVAKHELRPRARQAVESGEAFNSGR